MSLIGKVLETVDNHTQVIHIKYGAQYCMLKRMRDVVILYNWHVRKDGTIVLVGKSVEHELAPLEPEFTRAEVFASGYIIKPKVTFFMDEVVLLFHRQEDNPSASVVTYLTNLDLKVTNDLFKTTFLAIVQESQPLNISRLRNLITGSRVQLKKGETF